jgi:type VI protein secretion system component VasF
VALGTLAIRRVQRIPAWSAALIMLFAYLVWFYGLGGTFVR